MRESPVAKLRRLDGEIVLLSHIQGLLEWDLETGMPCMAEEERGRELSLVSRLIHERVTSAEMAETIESSASVVENPEDAAILRIRKKALEKESLVPADLVEELSAEKGRAHGAWVKAREDNDWNLFRPVLERLVSLSVQRVRAIDSSASPYDSMLSDYEEGMSVAVLDPVFSLVEDGVHRIMGEISGHDVDDSFLFRAYDKAGMKDFCNHVITAMGFDWTRGKTGISQHPFTNTVGYDDVRITNRFTDAGIFDPIGSAIHETGHALYAQHASLSAALRGTSAGRGASTGVHESQSRFWENIIGRSRAFWHGMYPVLRKYLTCLDDITEESFVKAINRSHPSAIRVNADELTYTLHIIIRYEVEKAMISGSVSFSDLPAYWNELSGNILHYTPANDAEGILQDCHWAGADFGYFPSYAVGNIYASQFFEAMQKDLGADNIDASLAAGEYSLITDWQNRNIWAHGAVYEPAILVRNVTGRAIDAGSYIRYLENRFRDLYL